MFDVMLQDAYEFLSSSFSDHVPLMKTFIISMLVLDVSSLFIFIEEPSEEKKINQAVFSGMISDDSQNVLLPTIFIIIIKS
jgi:hypothetical protein